jgi:hypothetical protein
MAKEKAIQRVERFKENGSMTLDLSGLQLTDDDLAEILQNGEILPAKVQYLFLHNNQLKLTPISKWTNLESLSLANNEIKKIPDEILELKKLKYLFIDEIQLKNSVETILKRTDLEISILEGETYISLSRESLSILNESKKIEKVRLEFEESRKLLNEANKYLDKITRWLTRAIEFYLLFLPLCLIASRLQLVVNNWDIIEPFAQVISLMFLTIATALGKKVGKVFHEAIKGLSKGYVFAVTNRFSKEYKEFNSEYEEIKSNLEDSNNRLLNRSA